MPDRSPEYESFIVERAVSAVSALMSRYGLTDEPSRAFIAESAKDNGQTVGDIAAKIITEVNLTVTALREQLSHPRDTRETYRRIAHDRSGWSPIRRPRHEYIA